MLRPAAIAVRIVVVAAIVLAAAAWLVTNRTVELRIDGVSRTVHSHARDVQGVLKQAGVEAGSRDELVPARQARVHHGDTVQLNRARRLTLTLDGRTRTMWVTAPTVEDVLTDLRMRAQALELSSSRSSRLPLTGATLEVRTRKQLTLVRAGGKETLTSYAATVDELLTERKVVLDGDDRTQPDRKAAIADGATVTVQQITTKEATETVTVPAPKQKKPDASLMLDQKKVLSSGQAGKEQQVVKYVYADGKQIERVVVSKNVLAAAKPQVTVQGTKPYPPDDTGLNWTALARCESHNNPRVVSSGGTYHGLYQFNVEMWQRMGGIGLPSQATPREQTYRAIKLYKAAGADQWPVCGSNLFS